MKTKTLSLIAASIATLSLAGTALAAGTGELATARVRYDDLNLSNDAGVASLYARLRHAASQVCESSPSRDLVDQSCVAKALDGAVAEVDNGRLTALHQRHAGEAHYAAGGR
jgi:UrcA family protein